MHKLVYMMKTEVHTRYLILNLESTTNLKLPASWSLVTNLANVTGNLNSIGMAPTSPSALYRLKQ